MGPVGVTEASAHNSKLAIDGSPFRLRPRVAASSAVSIPPQTVRGLWVSDREIEVSRAGSRETY